MTTSVKRHRANLIGLSSLSHSARFAATAFSDHCQITRLRDMSTFFEDLSVGIMESKFPSENIPALGVFEPWFEAMKIL